MTSCSDFFRFNDLVSLELLVPLSEALEVFGSEAFEVFGSEALVCELEDETTSLPLFGSMSRDVFMF